MNIFTIPATASFVDALAAGLMARANGDPVALSSMTILVPNRRAARGLRDAFLRKSAGTPLLLPTIRPIGDVAEDELLLGGAELSAADIPPAIDPLRRQIILAQYLKSAFPDKYTTAQGLSTAAELARFLDSVHTEGLSLDNLDTLVSQQYADHWQISLSFLKNVLSVFWPQHLESEGVIDPALRRRLMIEAYIAHLQSNPPATPIIAAGSTGSIPITAQLLKTIAGLPNGMVVLPGLDLTLETDAWDAISEGHPQAVMSNLLTTMDATRADVQLWPNTNSTDARQSLIAEIMRPAETTAAWTTMQGVTPDSFKNLHLLEAESLDDEATAIALIMREHAQDEDTDAATVLVTPDRVLAGRVTLMLRRWGIAVDDSAGLPLSHTPTGQWLLALTTTLTDDFAPIPLLATLKHTLSAGGDTPNWRNFVRDLDHYALRGVRPAPGLDGLSHRIDNLERISETTRSDLQSGIRALQNIFAPSHQKLRGTQDHLRALIAIAENLAATSTQPGAQRLWSGDAGEAAAKLLASLLDQGDILPDLNWAECVDLLEAAMKGATVRPRYGTHPRLAILGAIEARLYQADTMILGGLNEATWPALAEVDGWMSRPMRRDFELPAPERAITLSAHDFCQGLGASCVYLTRSKNRDGAPTTPSRWLQRLDAVMDAAKAPNIRAQNKWLTWAAALDMPTTFADPAKKPVGTPTIAQRPKSLSVTDIATLIKDPYAIYAKYTLGLRAWDDIDAEPGPKDRGNLIHKVLETFAKQYPDKWPDDALGKLLDTGTEIFAKSHDHPDVIGHWWPRFERMARALCNFEETWRYGTKRVYTEVSATHDLDVAGHTITLKGRADRIESRLGTGWSVIDYKSGTPPSIKDVTEGREPQLTLLGAMLKTGCFNTELGIDQNPHDIESIAYWPVGGNADTMKDSGPKENVDALCDAAYTQLIDILKTYMVDEAPYQSWPDASRLPQGGYDYAHLERMAEWANEGEEEDAA